MEPLDKNLEQVYLKSVSSELIDPLFRDLVDRANDLFVVVSGDGRIRYVNGSYCRLSGFEREKIEGCGAHYLVENMENVHCSFEDGRLKFTVEPVAPLSA